MRAMFALAVLLCAACASPPSPEPSGIRDTSFTDTGGARTIQFSTYINAGPAEVYQAVATVEGWKTWAVPSAFGEAKVGGVMETSYDRTAKSGDPGSIRQEFLALVPERLVVFRTIRTPPGFPHADLFVKTTTAIRLEPEGSGTRLTFTHAGFGPGEGFDQLHGFFSEGNKSTLAQLKKRFETGPVDWAAKEKEG